MTNSPEMISKRVHLMWLELVASGIDARRDGETTIGVGQRLLSLSGGAWDIIDPAGPHKFNLTDQQAFDAIYDR